MVLTLQAAVDLHIPWLLSSHRAGRLLNAGDAPAATRRRFRTNRALHAYFMLRYLDKDRSGPKPKRRRVAALQGIVLSLFTLPLAAQSVTFNKEVAPIVFKYCSPCHRPGEAAPFPLLSYGDVRKHALQIVAVTERRFMPPWPPEPGYGDFAGDRRLTAEQLNLIAEWVKAGGPEGEPSDLPAQPLFTEGWQMGTPGFPGMDVPTEARSDSFDPDSHFLFWKPGTALKPEPDDMGWRLEPGTDLILNMHLQPSGKEEMIQPQVGLYFTSQRPSRYPMLVQLEHDGALDIPPGAQRFEVTDRLILPIDLKVLAIYPHAHYLGKEVESWATLPDGSRRWLIKISDWDINWQAVYTYRNPIRLPKGSKVEMRVTYDNSTSNPRNPNQPPRRVRAGPRSQDEMGHVWLQVLPGKDSREDPRVTLQEAVMQRRLEKYPADFAAHCNLGALRAIRGEYGKAISNFQQALSVEPASATARNGLGAGFLAEGQFDDAIRELREALRLDPGHLNAHLNLARALRAKGDLSGAAVELDAFLKQKPDNADAQSALGLVYFAQGRHEEALPHFREAARLQPEDADIRTSLGAVLASRGDLAEAVKTFEQALKLNPNHELARAYLIRAQAELAGKR